MKKRILLLFLITLMVLSAVACQSVATGERDTATESTTKNEKKEKEKPGLYKSDGTFVSWEELTSMEYHTVEWGASGDIKRPILHVERGVLSAVHESRRPVDFSSYNLLEGKLVIDDSVVALASDAFYHCHILKEVVLPEGLTEISRGAFRECKQLVKIDIPSTVVSFGECAFEGCGFTEFVIPDSITTLEYSCFACCEQLTKVIFGDSVATIGRLCFASCNSLEEFIIPETIKTIREYAFSDCNALKKIYIPSSVECIEEDVFASCYSFVNVYTDVEDKPEGWDLDLSTQGNEASSELDYQVIWDSTIKDYNKHKIEK